MTASAAPAETARGHYNCPAPRLSRRTAGHRRTRAGQGSACRQAFPWRILRTYPASNPRAGADGRYHHARSLSSSRTRTPRPGAQDDLGKHQGLAAPPRGARIRRHFALARRHFPPRIRALLRRGRRPGSRRRLQTFRAAVQARGGGGPLASKPGTLLPRSWRSRRPPGPTAVSGPQSSRTRYLGTAADMAVALVLAFGSAAAGSRLLWPVLLIAAYYAAGVLLTGTSPMVALLGEPSGPPNTSDRLTTAAAAADEDVDPMLGHSSPRTIS